MRARRIPVVVAVLAVAALCVMAVRFRLGGRVREPLLSAGQIERIDRVVLERPDGLEMRFEKKQGSWVMEVRKGHFPDWDSLCAADASGRIPRRGSPCPVDDSQVSDFLNVFNFWEIARLPSEDENRCWKSFLRRNGGRLRLSEGCRTVLRLDFACRDDSLLVQAGRQCYLMRSGWKPSSWTGFFSSAPGFWQNRLLMDFDYLEIASVEVRYAGFPGGEGIAAMDGFAFGDTLSYKLELAPSGAGSSPGPGDEAAEDSPLADSCMPCSLLTSCGRRAVAPDVAAGYLSAFSQVYFEDLGDARRGRLLYELTVEPVQGGAVRVEVFEKLDPRGGSEPDIFKAVAAVERASGTDTVQIPYLVLDKMAKNAAWFRAEAGRCPKASSSKSETAPACLMTDSG